MDSTPKSRNEAPLLELRYRISQLEHLVVRSSLNASSVNSSLPSNSTLLHSQQGVDARINELEGLLAASENENLALRQHIDLITVDKNRQEVLLLEKLFAKDNQLKDLLYEQKLLEVKHQKAEKRLETIQDYINGLPSQNELDEEKEKNTESSEKILLLESNLEKMSGNIMSLQNEKLQLQKSVRELEIRIEELRPLEEAQKSFTPNSDLSTFDFTDKKKVEETLTLYKAHLIRNSKIISNLMDKISKLEEEKADGIGKIINLQSDLQTIQERLLSSQIKSESLTEKLKQEEHRNAKLQNENVELKQTLERRETFLQERNEHINSLIKLIAEIDICVKDVERLVELGQSLALGEEPSVSTLLGMNEELEMYRLPANTTQGMAESCSNFDPNDSQWTLERLVKVRSIRKNLSNLRDIASDLYTDNMVGSNAGCNVQ